ncbi:MAG: hypothetical protein CVV42_10115 [Candidatus Riflebacteria bacterium HGW-Riflebacteria-2]|jgi:hypothetical protein|nr:MAG: hypothetical protein CVV42_10115 [Candidatus Riflebacteria bacterium HGW-Riflebacteria-2]
MMLRLLALISVVVLLFPAQVCAQKAVELGVYADWRGDNCMYKSARPFFIIRDLYDLERFWQQANAAEGMPAIDFEKHMLLVWVPGPTMFDYRPAVVERFIYQDGFYIVVMDIQRKDSGGFWRRPFVATMLPNKTGDIFIMRKEVSGTHVNWKPLFTIWDMTGERTRPFEPVKIAKPSEPAKFIEHTRTTSTAGKTPVAATAASTTTAETVAVTTQTTKPVESVGAVAQAGERPAAEAAGSASAVSQPAKAGDGFEDIFGSPTAVKSEAKTEAKPQSTAPTVTQPVKQPGQPSLPAFAEDPLFGSEFDIEF